MWQIEKLLPSPTSRKCDHSSHPFPRIFPATFLKASDIHPPERVPFTQGPEPNGQDSGWCSLFLTSYWCLHLVCNLRLALVTRTWTVWATVIGQSSLPSTNRITAVSQGKFEVILNYPLIKRKK